MSAPLSKAERIAALNDAFRRQVATFGRAADIPGRCVTTRGIFDLGPEMMQDILWRVVAHHSFPEGDDPYGEHDFGAFDHPEAGKVFWKIDYYADHGCEWGSEHPEDPQRSYRVLTVMLAGEW